MKDRTANSLLAELHTVRDWLRWATSRFTEVGLSYGHGTSNALDEAAFLILHSLHLPIDQLDPWLEARLTMAEREALLLLIDARITTRKPAAYLTNTAYIGEHKFYVDERVIVPRSYIGELLRGRLSALVPEPEQIRSALDLCTGSACLAILMALAFERAVVDATDISADALEVARRNVRDYRLDSRVALHQGDLFGPLAGKRYDLIVANPPYVTTAAVAAFPAEYAAEPGIAHDGGADGLDIITRILESALRHLSPHGLLVVEIGHGRAQLEAARPDLDFLWLDTAESEGEVFALSAGDLVGRDAGRRPSRRRTVR